MIKNINGEIVEVDEEVAPAPEPEEESQNN